MAAFNWKRAIEMLASEVEACVMCAAQSRREGYYFSAFKYEREAESKSSYAAWIARSYCRKGRKAVRA